VLNDWKKYLAANGFDKTGRRDFFREATPVSAHIYETPLRVGERKFRMNVAVEIKDPWVRPREYHVMHLRGDITPEGIYVHCDETPTWLHPDEADSVYSVVNQCLMSWIDHWSNPSYLIEYFENPPDIVMTRPSPLERPCEHIVGVPARNRLSPARDYVLSLLHYHVGDFPKALAAARRYFEFRAQTNLREDEPQRTKRQIDEIMAKISSAQA
jgi:hypothetical protein